MFDTDFDGQKLMYHPVEVAEWLKNGITRGPIYTEMELYSGCNHDCIFCAIDYLRSGRPEIMDAGSAKRIIGELLEIGNKAIMFSGHGEPLLNPEAGAIIKYASSLMSASVTTNGTMLDADRIDLIDGLEWIRFSVNGCSPEIYSMVHKCAPRFFDLVTGNISAAVRRKRERKLKIVIGVQTVLLRENYAGIVEAGRLFKEIGADYFSVKPYLAHPMSMRKIEADYSDFPKIGRELKTLEDGSFRVICRTGSMAKLGKPKPYGKCFGTHFMSFISANGDVWECGVFCGDTRFLDGNAIREGLAEVWNSGRRKRALHYIQNSLDLKLCRDVCRMDECNRYLWRVRNPFHHDNFI